MKNSSYQYAANQDIEIRVDFARPSTQIDFRFLNEDWVASPYQSADLNHLSVDDVLNEVNEYLESQG